MSQVERRTFETAAPVDGQIKRIWGRVFRAIVEWAAHCVVVAAILGGIRMLESWIYFLWGGEDIHFLGMIPLAELIRTFDFVLLAMVLALGISCVVRTYRSET